MTSRLRVSSSLSAVAVSALEPSQRAAMAVPRQAMQGRREAHAAALHGPTEDAAARSPVADGGNAAANVTGESSGGCCQPSSLARGRQRGALARGEGAEEFTGQNGK